MFRDQTATRERQTIQKYAYKFCLFPFFPHNLNSKQLPSIIIFPKKKKTVRILKRKPLLRSKFVHRPRYTQLNNVYMKKIRDTTTEPRFYETNNVVPYNKKKKKQLQQQMREILAYVNDYRISS